MDDGWGGVNKQCPVHWQPRLRFSSVPTLKMMTEQLQINQPIRGIYPRHQLRPLPIQTNKTNLESRTTVEGIDRAKRCYCDIHCKKTPGQHKYGNNSLSTRSHTYLLVPCVGWSRWWRRRCLYWKRQPKRRCIRCWRADPQPHTMFLAQNSFSPVWLKDQRLFVYIYAQMLLSKVTCNSSIFVVMYVVSRGGARGCPPPPTFDPPLRPSRHLWPPPPATPIKISWLRLCMQCIWKHYHYSDISGVDADMIRRFLSEAHSHLTDELWSFVDEFIGFHGLFGVRRFPGQLDAGIGHSTHLELPRLPRNWNTDPERIINLL